MEKFGIKQNKELRDSKYIIIVNKKIQNYINNECIGSLFLSNTPISKLPNNLKYIGGHLVISVSNISELPDDIKIKGNLYCYNTPLIRKYGKNNIKKKWKIYGDVYY